MCIEKTQNKTSNISTFQGSRGCIIQTLQTTKTIKNQKTWINFWKNPGFSTPAKTKSLNAIRTEPYQRIFNLIRQMSPT